MLCAFALEQEKRPGRVQKPGAEDRPGWKLAKIRNKPQAAAIAAEPLNSTEKRAFSRYGVTHRLRRSV